jgi:hypothetical protein
LAAAAVPIYPRLLPDLDTELYAHGNVRGTIWIDRVNQHLTIDVASAVIDFEYVFDPALQPGLDFVPLCFTQYSRSSTLIAGFDSILLSGKLVLLEYDISTGIVPPATVVYTGSSFTRPASIARIPGVPSLAVLDADGSRVLIHELRTGTSTLIASAATYPQLAIASHISAAIYNDPLSSLSGLVLTASAEDTASVVGPMSPSVALFDFDGDGLFDLIK